jgi:hypothetical protein
VRSQKKRRLYGFLGVAVAAGEGRVAVPTVLGAVLVVAGLVLVVSLVLASVLTLLVRPGLFRAVTISLVKS